MNEKIKKSILLVVLIFGAFASVFAGVMLGIHNTKTINEKNENYKNALFIDDLTDEIYGKYVLAEGTISATNPVTIPDVEGNYISLEKVFYKKKLVTQPYTVNGKTKYRYVRRWRTTGDPENYNSETITFCNKEYKTTEFDLPDKSFLLEVPTETYHKYKINGISDNIKGTLLIELDGNQNIVDEIFYENKTAKEIQEELIVDPTGFSIFFIILGCVGSAICMVNAARIHKSY